MSDLISQWCARYRGETLVTKYHYIESVIADRLITHCGRQMPRLNGDGELVVDPSPAPTSKCERCAK